jgi:nitrate/nitrite transporter NarK
VALINAVGAVGGFVGPYAMGLARDATGDFSAGLLLMAPLLLSGAIVTWKLRASPALSGGAQDV